MGKAQVYYPKGVYWCKVTGQSFGENKNGNAQFVLSFVVQGQVDPKDPQGDLLSCENYDRTIFMTITEGTIEFVTEHLEKLGFKGTSLSHLSPDTDGYHDFVGTEFAAFVKHETYEGTTREKWSVDSGPREAKPLEESKLRKLDAMFGANRKKAPAASAASPTPAKVSPESQKATKQESRQTVPRGDSEIPF